MRIATLALLAWVVPAVAQEPVPDTTAPWLYYPLEVGNEWEYENYWGFGGPTDYFRRAIVGDTVVAGVTYFVEAFFSDWSGPGWRFVGDHLVRYDSATTRLVELRDGADEPLTCRLDAAFSSWLDCHSWDGPNGPEETMVGGQYADTLRFWRTEEDLIVPALKTFASIVDAGAERFAATIGYVGNEDACCQDGFVRIRYARVSGVEYGAQIFVGAEPPPNGPSSVLRALPNPTSGRLVLVLDVPATGAIAVEAFDALGRRVHRRVKALAAGAHELILDTARWAPGAYLVRVSAGDVNVSARVVRR